MIALFAVISITVGMRVRRVDRWIVILVAALMLFNVILARANF